MVFRVTKPELQFKNYWTLWQSCKKNYTSPVAADLFYRRLLKADFLVLKNNFNVATFGLYKKEKPRIMATHYCPNNNWPGPECLGAFAVSPGITDEEISEFWRYTKDITNHRPLIAPLNGHHYLGVSLPDEQANPKKIGIFNAGASPEVRKLFQNEHSASYYRTYLSFETNTSESLKARLKNESSELPEDFRVRPFSKLHAKRDLSLFNQLVNRCFTEHFDFCPLSDEENYDIMKMSLPMINKNHFNFLEHKGQAIGFCMSMKDYHQIWDNKSDIKNIARFIFKGKSVKRARAIHIGIDKNYRGQRLTRYLRHRTFLNLINDGIEVIENSYIDEGNEASIANVQSTGAKFLNEFHLFQIGTKNAQGLGKKL